jgi:hypothetical protein
MLPTLANKRLNAMEIITGTYDTTLVKWPDTYNCEQQEMWPQWIKWFGHLKRKIRTCVDVTHIHICPLVVQYVDCFFNAF